jgi:hypothetical protein
VFAKPIPTPGKVIPKSSEDDDSIDREFEEQKILGAYIFCPESTLMKYAMNMESKISSCSLSDETLVIRELREQVFEKVADFFPKHMRQPKLNILDLIPI